MYAFGVPLGSFVWATLLVAAEASYIATEYSFGTRRTISSDRNRKTIDNFHLVGDPDPPEILSNKLILTPPAVGHQRGAVWSEKPLLFKQWTAQVDFRTSGPERGSGNFQLWYTKDGRQEASTASIYTAKQFDGLAIVVDQYTGSTGYIRGFLNDGTTEYSSHHSVDSLAFGHCAYAYRNLGRPSRLLLKYNEDIFRVEIDGNLCFETNKIKLPAGYHFGMSAASSENPDSFEVFRFVVMTETEAPDIQNPDQFNEQQRLQQEAEGSPINRAAEGDIPSFSDPPDVQASTIKDADAQFADLHNRLQAMMRHITEMNRELVAARQNNVREQQALSDRLNRLENVLAKLDYLPEMDNRISSISNDVKQTKNDLHNALDRQFLGLKNIVSSQHNNVLGVVANNAPRIGMYIFVVLGSQLLLVVGYVLYKKRKGTSYKKYL